MTVEELYEKYYTGMVYFARNILGDADAAEDAATDVFVSIIKNNNAEKISRNPKAYLFIAVRNRCRYILEGRANRYKTLKRCAEFSQDYESDLEFYRIKEHIISEIFAQIDAKLAPRAKDIFLLRHYFGLSIKRVAQIINRSPQTVQASLGQSMAKLKKFFKNKRVEQ